jgi:hypothetical protein
MFWSSAASVSANMRPLSASRSSRADVSTWIAPIVDVAGVRAPPVVALESVFASFMSGVPLARNDMNTHAKRTAARQPLTKRSLCDTDASLYARLASHILVESVLAYVNIALRRRACAPTPARSIAGGRHPGGRGRSVPGKGL